MARQISGGATGHAQLCLQMSARALESQTAPFEELASLTHLSMFEFAAVQRFLEVAGISVPKLQRSRIILAGDGLTD